MAQSNLNKCHFFPFALETSMIKHGNTTIGMTFLITFSVIESDVLMEKMKCIFVVVLEGLDWWQATGSCP